LWRSGVASPRPSASDSPVRTELMAAGIVLAVIALMLVALMRRSGQHAAAEEREAFERRQKEAVIADGERADAIEDAAQAARRVPVDDRGAAADVLRKSNRLRKTGD
jgi:membrane protein implicated in regulation of membrane protease activity